MKSFSKLFMSGENHRYPDPAIHFLDYPVSGRKYISGLTLISTLIPTASVKVSFLYIISKYRSNPLGTLYLGCLLPTG